MSAPATYFTQTRPEMLAFIPASAKRILDVGCGAGAFTAQLKDRGSVELWGVEMDDTAATEAKTKLDTVLIGDIADQLAELPDGYFDCIIFNDILEHLVDPYSILQQLKAKLADGGVMVSSIPNVRYFLNLWHVLVQKDWQYEDHGIRDRTHLRFFTKKSLNRMWRDLGFEVVQFEGVNPITSWKFTLINVLTFGFLKDTKYLQFASVVRPKK